MFNQINRDIMGHMIDSRLKSVKPKNKKPPKPFTLEQNTEGHEGWRDPYTGLRLAPGGIQNWADKEDERYIKYLHIYGSPLQGGPSMVHVREAVYRP